MFNSEVRKVKIQGRFVGSRCELLSSKQVTSLDMKFLPLSVKTAAGTECSATWCLIQLITTFDRVEVMGYALGQCENVS